MNWNNNISSYIIFKGLRPLPPAPLGIGDLVTTGLVGLAGLAELVGLAEKKTIFW